MDTCPCKGCDTREAGCHSGCSAYNDWRKAKDEERVERMKIKSHDVFFSTPRKHRYAR